MLLQSSDAFGFRHSSPVRRQQYRSQNVEGMRLERLTSLFALDEEDENDDSATDSWSRSAAITASSRRRSSPLKVRKRVKAVLEKARTRTGIRNGSASSSSSSTSGTDSRQVQSVVAEAASIGGLGDGPADIVVQIPTNGTSELRSTSARTTNGVSAPTNGTANNGYKPLTEEQLGLQKNGAADDKNGAAKPSSFTASVSSGASSTIPPRKPKDFDVIRGDVPAAAEYVDPLPFQLPKLSKEQHQRLRNGERIQEQSRMGREGSGYVVLDVKAPPFVVWETLLDFEAYPETIPTVKSMQLYTSEKLNVGFVNEKPVMPGTGREARHYGTASVTRAAFTLSKFRLNIAAIHRYTPHPLGDYMIFTLDKSCTNMVLKGAKGIWYTEEDPDGRKVREIFGCLDRCGFVRCICSNVALL
jgi:hypothetical protein